MTGTSVRCESLRQIAALLSGLPSFTRDDFLTALDREALPGHPPAASMVLDPL